MKKTLMIAAAAAVMMTGIAATEAVASPISKCKACHNATKDKVGPAFAKVVKAYGTPEALAALWDSGFAVADRKVAAEYPKFKKKAKIMTGQYKHLIKGKDHLAIAKALFASVK